MQIEVLINNKKITMEIENDELLADTLRANGWLSVRKGCDSSSCGLCTVWIDEKPVLSCTIFSFRAHGKSITTIEGVREEAGELARFLAAEGADQCGFCSPGLLMTVLAMKRELPDPTEETVKHYLTGNLCRCTGYIGQLRAIKKYLGVA